MIKYLIVLPIFIITIIVSISFYLQPNDMANCGDRPSTTKSCMPVDAIIAISGGDTNARTDEAIELYQNGWSNIIIFSGAAEDKSGPSNANVMQARALNHGVPQSAILIEEDSSTTKQNANNIKHMLLENNMKTIMLVTSGYHQRRASLVFNKQIDGITILNHPTSSDRDWSAWWWTNPRGWTLAVGELFNIIIFYIGAND